MTDDRQENTISPREETLPALPENRILILGSTLTGAFKLQRTLQTYLEQKHIPEPEVQVLRDVRSIEEAFLGRDTAEEGRENPKLPKGVILLPKMRWYSEIGTGMDVRVFEEGISEQVEELCRKWGVPLVKIPQYEEPKQIEEGLKELLEPKK